MKKTTIKSSKIPPLFLILFFLINQVIGQNNKINDKIKETGDKVSSAITNGINNLFKGKRNKQGQNEANQKSNENNEKSNLLTFDGGYPLTRNIYVNINGEYPNGYQPSWRFIGKVQNLELKYENYIDGGTGNQAISFGIVEYQGKTVLKQNAFTECFPACECIADIVLPSSKITLNSTPQRFPLRNFRVIDSQTPCYPSGGRTSDPEGYITLSADNNGNITFDFKLKVFYKENPYFKLYGKASYLIYGNSLSMPNEMTPDKAILTIQNIRKNEIEDSLATIAYEKRKAEETRLFEMKIKNSYEKVSLVHKKYNNFSNCIKIDSGSKSESYTDYVYSLVKIETHGGISGVAYELERRLVPQTNYRTVKYEGFKNNCKIPIVILGIKKLKSPLGTIYYEDASITLEAGEMTDYKIDIENNYNSKLAEVGSIHYFKNKILIK